MGSLVEDLRRMLNNDRFSDMVFLCGEEKEEVPALRMLVAARSSTLESMLLTSGMAETKLSRIPLPDMEASTMRICMEFFYTGTVQDSSWTGVFSTMKVIFAGRFFLNSNLEHLAISRLSEYQFLDDEAFLVDIAKAYSCGVEQPHDHPRMSFVMQRLRDWIIFNALFSLKCYRHLTEQAFVHLVQNVDMGRFTIREYCIFHLIVRWCSSQLIFSSEDPFVTEQVVQNTIEKAFPWLLEDVYKCVLRTEDENKAAVTRSMLEIMKHLADPVASCLKKVNVNLSGIPAQILSKIIEPLEIVPSSMLFVAYKIQALSIPMR